MQKFSTKHATLLIIASLIILILFGTLFFKSNIIFLDNINLSNIDSVLNSTALACGMGYLTVEAENITNIGKLFIVSFLMIGNIGLITIIIFIASFFKRKGIEWYAIASELFDVSNNNSLFKFIKSMLISTLTLEFLGAFIYKYILYKNNKSISFIDSFYISTSMFCNSGLSSTKEICLAFSSSASYYIVSTILMLIGGMGFLVIFEFHSSLFKIKGSKYNLSLTTRIILKVYFYTVFISWMMYFYFFENTFSILSLSRSLFACVSMKSVGYLPYKFSSSSFLLFSSLYGIIGTAPLGTGGGIKTSLFSILIYTPISFYKKYNSVIIFNKIILWKKVLFAHLYTLYILLFSIIGSLIMCINLNDQNYIFIFSDILNCMTGLGLNANMEYYNLFFSKVIFIIFIILGRILSITIGLNANLFNNQNTIIYPEGKLIII